MTGIRGKDKHSVMKKLAQALIDNNSVKVDDFADLANLSQSGITVERDIAKEVQEWIDSKQEKEEQK